jgi:hypothetical protein
MKVERWSRIGKAILEIGYGANQKKKCDFMHYLFNFSPIFPLKFLYILKDFFWHSPSQKNKLSHLIFKTN